jgi:Bacterial protein of unknown function (DUF903)
MIDVTVGRRDSLAKRRNNFVMKKLVALLFLSLLAGCRSSYDVTLNNGALYSGVSKPKLDRERGVYVFKNVTGHIYTIPETRVRTVEPHSSGKEKQKFQNQNDFNSSGR